MKNQKTKLWWSYFKSAMTKGYYHLAAEYFLTMTRYAVCLK